MELSLNQAVELCKKADSLHAELLNERHSYGAYGYARIQTVTDVNLTSIKDCLSYLRMKEQAINNLNKEISALREPDYTPSLISVAKNLGLLE